MIFVMGLFFVYCSAIFELSILRNHLHNLSLIHI